MYRESIVRQLDKILVLEIVKFHEYLHRINNDFQAFLARRRRESVSPRFLSDDTQRIICWIERASQEFIDAGIYGYFPQRFVTKYWSVSELKGDDLER